ncbi:MAG: CDP-diacylglycerol--glycerol-3-phosphate 3-phosphatidyltransferase [bacterium]
MTLPNKLTISRILLIPVFIILLINEYKFPALLIFGLASLTDALDGIIARVRNQRSRLGFFLDPVADKLLVNTSFITLAIMDFIPSWLAVIIMARDILITLGVMSIYIWNERPVISPTLIGKSTTMIQMSTIFLVLLNLWAGHLSMIVCFFIWLSALLTIISGFEYIYVGARMQDGKS